MFKKFLQEKGISEEEFSKMDAADTAKLQSEYNDLQAKELNDLKEQASKAATKEEVKAVTKKLNDFLDKSKEVSDDTIKSLKDEAEKLREVVKNQGIEMSKLKEKGNNTGGVSFLEAVKNAVKEKSEEFKEFLTNKQKGGFFDFQIKAPEAVTSTHVTSAATPDNYTASNADGYSPYTREEIFVENFFDMGSTDKPTIGYVNEEAGEGDAAIVAEGSLKPLIDADFNVKFSQAAKVAGRMKASEEALFDFKWLESAMKTTLKRKHDIAKQDQLLNGDGLGSNLSGIKTIATPFNAALLTGITVSSPQFYDAIASVAAAIEVQSEGVFVPNVAFVNTIDALQMKLTKDDDKNYILPPFISQDGRVIDNIRVVAKPTIPVGEFVIGDMKNVKLRNVWGYTVRIGQEMDDLSKNMYTMIGESRLHLYITDNDKRGIISGTFADVITAITQI